jgi:uncharacterized protein YdhG (YjbR/CyaY superfamily)
LGKVRTALPQERAWLRRDLQNARAITSPQISCRKEARMPGKRPATIAEYIQAAAPVAQPHLRSVHAILARVAPDAEQVIKWGNPFFVEPRFLFAFSAHKAHLSFAPSEAALAKFGKELESHETTKNFLKIRYDEPVPEALVRRIAEYQLGAVSKRKDDSFW